MVPVVERVAKICIKHSAVQKQSIQVVKEEIKISA